MAFETVLFEKRGRVGLITFNRPQVLNALNAQLIAELNQALDVCETDDGDRRRGAHWLGEGLRSGRGHQGVEGQILQRR